jgi:hypothetical protein
MPTVLTLAEIRAKAERALFPPPGSEPVNISAVIRLRWKRRKDNQLKRLIWAAARNKAKP